MKNLILISFIVFTYEICNKTFELKSNDSECHVNTTNAIHCCYLKYETPKDTYRLCYPITKQQYDNFTEFFEEFEHYLYRLNETRVVKLDCISKYIHNKYFIFLILGLIL